VKFASRYVIEQLISTSKYLTVYLKLSKKNKLSNTCLKYFIPSVSVLLSPVVLRPNADYGLLMLEVSRSHTTTHHSR